MLRRARRRGQSRAEREARALAEGSRASRRWPRSRPSTGRTVGELRNDPEWRPRTRRSDRRGVRGRRRRTASRCSPRHSGRSSTRWPMRPRPPRPATSSPVGAPSSTRSSARVLRSSRAIRRPVPDADRARSSPQAVVSEPSVVAFVPARSGSERVPHKNVRPLAGHPLLAYAIETALPERRLRARGRARPTRRRSPTSRAGTARTCPSCGPAEYATSTSPDIEWLAYTLGAARASGTTSSPSSARRTRSAARTSSAAASSSCSQRRRPTRSARSSS